MFLNMFDNPCNCCYRVYTKGKMFESIVEMYKSIEDFDNVLRVQRRLGMGNDTSMLIEHAEASHSTHVSKPF